MEAVTTGRAASMSTFLDGREVDSQYVSKVATEHAGAMLEKWDQGGAFSLSLDASRLSSPLDEMVFYACWHADSRTA